LKPFTSRIAKIITSWGFDLPSAGIARKRVRF
jgi:hypothetical protein